MPVRGWSSPHRASWRLPQDTGELAHPPPRYEHALRDEQGALERLTAPVPTHPSTSGNDTMARYVGATTLAHDVAHGPGRPGSASRRCDTTVGGHATRRNAANHAEHARRELRSGPHVP